MRAVANFLRGVMFLLILLGMIAVEPTMSLTLIIAGVCMGLPIAMIDGANDGRQAKHRSGE